MIVDPKTHIRKPHFRGRRVRFSTQHFMYESASAPHKRSEEEEQVRSMRAMLETNKTILLQSGYQHACPLLCEDAGIKWPPTSYSLDALTKVQPKKKGRAPDGYEYDLERIKNYIRNNMERELVSPVTGEPMTACVAFVVNGRSKKTPYDKKLKIMEWRPSINGDEDDTIVPVRMGC